MAHFLEDLAHDADRFVWAGAQAARGDAALARQRTTLQAAGQKVPALAKAAEVARELEQSDEERAGAALLQLNLAAAQLRASQLKPEAPAGDLAPLAPMDARSQVRAAPVQVLYLAEEALHSKKKPADALVRMLTEDELAHDPRLWPGLVEALGNTYLRDVAAGLVGRIGPAILPTLEAGLKKKGGAADASRLRAIGQIRGAEGEALYRECLRTGSWEVKLAAIVCLGRVDLAEAEKALLTLAEETKSDDRHTLVAPLLQLGSPRALEALLDMCASERAVIVMLKEMISDPQRDQLAALLEARAAAGSTRLPKDTHLQDLLGIFAEAPTPAGLSMLRAMLNHRDFERQESAALALLKTRDPEAARDVIRWARTIPSAGEISTKALFLLPPAEVYAHFEPMLRRHLPEPEIAETASAEAESRGAFAKIAKLFGGRSAPAAPAPQPRRDEVKKIDPRVLAALPYLDPSADDRWVDALVAIMPLEPVPVIKAIAELRNAKAVPPLLDVAVRDLPGAAYAVNALGVLGAREAVPGLVALLDNPPNRERLTGLVAALMHIGDPRAIPALDRVAETWASDTFVTSYVRAAIRKLMP